MAAASGRTTPSSRWRPTASTGTRRSCAAWRSRRVRSRRDRAEAHLESIFHGQKLDWITEGTVENRERWHNLKYFTWVEQQGKTVAELDAQRSERWWAHQAALAGDVDRRLREVRGW